VTVQTRKLVIWFARAAALACGVAAADVWAATGAVRAKQMEPAPRAVVLEYDGIVHPIAVEVISDLLAHAEATDASVAVLVLRTPGGLLESTRAIVSQMIASKRRWSCSSDHQARVRPPRDSCPPCCRRRSDGAWHACRCRTSGWGNR
jgi:membrane-bound ClpP family serine protease